MFRTRFKLFISGFWWYIHKASNISVDAKWYSWYNFYTSSDDSKLERNSEKKAFLMSMTRNNS